VYPGESLSMLALVLVVAQLSTAQSVDIAAYQRLVHVYRSVRSVEAVAELAAWPADRIVAAGQAARE
jgi:hypothetical protein